jgi:hypothetical protein
MKWTGNVAYMEDLRNICRILVGSHEWKRPLDRIILKRLLGRKIRGVLTGLMWFRITNGV